MRVCAACAKRLRKNSPHLTPCDWALRTSGRGTLRRRSTLTLQTSEGRIIRAPFYEMAGVAKWCMDANEDAVALWQAGVKSAYADAAGGVRLPILLFVASVLSPESFPRAEAEKLLTARTGGGRIWPGPLGKYLLGHIDETGLISWCVNRDGSEDFMKRWQADFYLGIRATIAAMHRNSTN